MFVVSPHLWFLFLFVCLFFIFLVVMQPCKHKKKFDRVRDGGGGGGGGVVGM